MIEVAIITLGVRKTDSGLEVHAEPKSCLVNLGRNVVPPAVAWANQSEYDLEVSFDPPGRAPIDSRAFTVRSHLGEFSKFKEPRNLLPDENGNTKRHYRVGVWTDGFKLLDPIDPAEADIDIMLDEGDTEADQ